MILKSWEQTESEQTGTKKGEKRRDSPAGQQSEDGSREQANGAGMAGVDPREDSGVNGRKREMGNGEKAASR